MREKDVEYLKKYLPSDQLREGISLLEKGISPQYIVGNVDFYGNIMKVDNRVLIPRFETELLVEKTLYYIHQLFSDISLENLQILDIGTGSGCIAITMKKELGCHVVGVDISPESITLARENAQFNQVEVSFLVSDLFSRVDGAFDVVISNPPYISEDEEIEEIVKNNEPHLALYASNHGLYYYDEILKRCSKHLKKRFLIAFEIGKSQGEEVMRLAHQYLNEVNVVIEKDYSNKNRFVFIISK